MNTSAVSVTKVRGGSSRTRPLIPIPPAQARIPGIVYVPCLALKTAEAAALHTMDGRTASSIYPLVTLRQVPDPTRKTDELTGELKFGRQKLLPDHLNDQADLILRALGVEQQLFASNNGVTRLMLDMSLIDQQQRMSLLGAMSARLQGEARYVVPVVRLDSQPDHLSAAKAWNTQHRTGVAVRAWRTKQGYPTAAVLVNLARAVATPTAQTDVILDVGSITANSTEATYRDTLSLLVAIYDAAQWRSVILASGAFPQSLGALECDLQHHLVRWDLILWKRLRLALRRLRPQMRLIFGDYGIVYKAAADAKTMSPVVPHIRYTCERAWMIYRRELKPDIEEICRAVLRHDEFRGEAFSAGDRWMDRCSRSEEKPGNVKDWLRAGWQHHLVFVVEQLRGRT